MRKKNFSKHFCRVNRHVRFRQPQMSNLGNQLPKSDSLQIFYKIYFRAFLLALQKIYATYFGYLHWRSTTKAEAPFDHSSDTLGEGILSSDVFYPREENTTLLSSFYSRRSIQSSLSSSSR